MPYNLKRFLDAQEHNYQQALYEIKTGRKRSHWIWYIFPQLKGLGRSSLSEYYGIDGLSEAKAYIRNDILKERLLEISEALLELEDNDANAIMGYPDNLKLHSSMTLFSYAAPELDVFRKVLWKYYQGIDDFQTLEIIKEDKNIHHEY